MHKVYQIYITSDNDCRMFDSRGKQLPGNLLYWFHDADAGVFNDALAGVHPDSSPSGRDLQHSINTLRVALVYQDKAPRLPFYLEDLTFGGNAYASFRIVEVPDEEDFYTSGC